MNFSIHFPDEADFVNIIVHDDVNGETQRELAQNAIELAKEKGVNKFLVDVRGVKNTAATFEQYQLGYKDMAKFLLDRGSKIAICVDTHDHSHDFIETVFKNAGYHCHIFRDQPEALDWLSVASTSDQFNSNG